MELSKKDQQLAITVGRRIRELRQDRGWDQVDLEAHLDEHVKRATLSDFETGRRLPSLRTLGRLAEAFEVEPAELLLNPSDRLAHRVAGAVLRCPQATLEHVAKLVDVD